MILVTGATGFLGHNLVPFLLKAGYLVRTLVRPGSDVAFLQELGVELAYAQDITDETAVRQACRGCQQIIHAAGYFRFWGNFDEFYSTNFRGTATVLEAALASGVERVIHISTIAVVGQTPSAEVITEETRCRPQDPYQVTKLEAEQLALSYYKEKGLPVIVLRPGAFYGPWGHYAFNRLFFEEPLKGWRIRVNNGRHITFPVFVPDVVRGIEMALRRGQPGAIYNICGQSLDHNSINHIVSDLAGISRWRMNIPTSAVVTLARIWTFLSRYTGREPFYPINMAPYVFQDWHVSYDKAARELGFTPTSFAVGTRETLEWYWREGLLKRRH